ncbi:MAG: alpha-amylase [Verrucomicrobia bacterium]|nr:alpha-amylase [Verrucomicrobiota bacterium]
MVHPLLYEINTHCWLRELTARHRRRITLGDVPESELDQWRCLGFTHLWLMGVWTTGPKSRAHSLNSPELRRQYAEILPDWTPDDVAGSPYAIADYAVPPALGGESGLCDFRKRLRERGLKLVLDFVPNHVGLDHPWLLKRPEFFVQTTVKTQGTFRANPKQQRWEAFAKDPYFPPWRDTAQLDHRCAETRAALIAVLQSIASLCDGVRCDMAMLALADVFVKTWAGFPCASTPVAGEFWMEAIANVRREHPDFLFLAEAYWGLEPRLQALGFDFTYDKTFCECLIRRDAASVQKHLLDAPTGFVAHSAHFLENHDEARVASLLSLEEHRAAALLTLGLPGMRLLHEGQLQGARLRTPVHLAHRPVESTQPDIANFYERLLIQLQHTAVGRGAFKILHPRPAWPENPTAQYFILVQWQSQPEAFDLVVVNLAPHRSQCYAPLAVIGLTQRDWQLNNLLGDEVYTRPGAELDARGLYLELPAHGSQLFHFTPAG